MLRGGGPGPFAPGDLGLLEPPNKVPRGRLRGPVCRCFLFKRFFSTPASDDGVAMEWLPFWCFSPLGCKVKDPSLGRLLPSSFLLFSLKIPILGLPKKASLCQTPPTCSQSLRTSSFCLFYPPIPAPDPIPASNADIIPLGTDTWAFKPTPYLSHNRTIPQCPRKPEIKRS